ncbi:DegV family protein [Hungatella sp.]|uniref:DegV family protein n=1 Tax=Hungatella sp. TaxID=2613924 RepID=UPI0025901443|nr:DegV family protein [Hungatella sp.]MCI6455492.1 DegV family protein [Hungatella sp.]
MKRIGISADSSCDLSAELAEQYGIAVIPQAIIMDGKTYRDGIELKPADIFRHVSEGGEICSTTAINTAEYCGVFSELRKECGALIHFTIGSGLSSCYQNAVLAANEVPGVTVVDSMNLTTGIGYLAVAAAKMAAAGMELEEITAKLEELKAHMDVSFVIDKLDYFKKGGRCSAVTAFGANLLNIKPSICMKNGTLAVEKKYRGAFRQCVRRYIEERLDAVKDRCVPDIIFLTHAACSEAVLEEAADLIRSRGIFSEILVTEAGCTVSSHCGPNTLGIIFAVKS